MSKDLHNYERYLKDLANKHEPVPPPSVWGEVEQVLDKDKPKRRLFPILWLFGVLLIGAIMFINIIGKKDKQFPVAEQEPIVTDHQKQSDPNIGNISPVDSEAINELKQGRNANILETMPPVSDNQEGKKVAPEKLKSLVTPQHQSSNLNTSTADRSFKANTNTINTNQTAIITIENIFRPGIFTQSTQSTQSTLEDRPIIQATALQKLEWMPVPFVTGMPLPDLTENLTLIPSSESKGRASLATPWFVELEGGIGLNLSNPVWTDPAQGTFRLNTESRWYAWSTSFQLGYQFDNSWYTSIGFDFNQTKKRFDFWRRNVSSLLVDENQSLRVTNGDFFSIGEISYTFADIGLSIGKRVNIGKLNFSLEGGLIFNTLFKANGKVQIGVLEFSRLEDQEGYFNNQMGIGARLSAMLDFPVSERMWLSVGPSYHQYLNTVSSEGNDFEERNAILQVKASVRCHF